jgi:hypothetical protein
MMDVVVVDDVVLTIEAAGSYGVWRMEYGGWSME